MDFYIQQAHGMQTIISEFAEKWKSGTVILSPTDMDQKRLVPYAQSLNKKGMKTVIDPQCYSFHASKNKLISQSYWINNYVTSLFDSESIRWQLHELKSKYYDNFDSPFFIVPFPLITDVNEMIYSMLELYFTCIDSMDINNPYISIPLCSDVIIDEKKMHLLLEYLEMFAFKGIYLVPAHPGGNYLVDNPVWLANIMDFCAGVKLSGKKVVVGYSNHQSLILGVAKVDAIASGNFLNSRSFSLEKFSVPLEGDNFRNKSIWFYSPQTLSEYQILYLDMARKIGSLEKLKPAEFFLFEEVTALFSGAQPTSVNFPERFAFVHYLNSLKIQSEQLVLDTFEKTYANIKLLFESAQVIASELHDQGVRAKNRDYLTVYDATMSAIDQFGLNRGLVMKVDWDNL